MALYSEDPEMIQMKKRENTQRGCTAGTWEVCLVFISLSGEHLETTVCQVRLCGDKSG